MANTLIVGKHSSEGHDANDYTEATEIAVAELFTYLLKGYVVLPQEYIDARNAEAAAAAAEVATASTRKSRSERKS